MDQVVAIDLQRGIVTVAFDGAPSIRIRERHFRKKPLEEGAYVDSEAYRNSLAALQFSDAYEAALTALDRSARTGRQLSDGLRRKGYLPEVADAVVARLRENGFRLVNCDCTVIAQRPKLAPYIPQMRANLAQAMDAQTDQVSVKATTEEGLGFSGEGLGIAAHAVALIERIPAAGTE